MAVLQSLKVVEVRADGACKCCPNLELILSVANKIDAVILPGRGRRRVGRVCWEEYVCVCVKTGIMIERFKHRHFEEYSCAPPADLRLLG